MPSISIIVPVYNIEKDIYRCVDSIRTQTFPDFELILVDDGSTDGSGKICDEYSTIDDRITVIHKSNGGVSEARNAGIKKATGEYCTYIDSDDYVSKDYLEKLIFVAKQQRADMVLSGFVFVNDKCEPIQAVQRKVGTWNIDSHKLLTDYMIHQVLHFGNGWTVCTSLFKTSIITNHHIQSKGIFAEDMGFTLEYLMYVKKIVAIDFCGYFYVQHSGSMMDRCKDVMMLDALNEVGYSFGRRYLKETHDWKAYTILYYLIMENQYCKVPAYGEGFKHYLDSKELIHRLGWHDKWMRRLIFCYKDLKKIYGSKEAKIRILNSRLISHHNWKWFCIESAIAYKFFIK